MAPLETDMEPGFDVRIEGVVKGYHAYKIKPAISEILACERDRKNRVDVNAVRVAKNVPGCSALVTVGHVPWGFSAAFSVFIAKNNAKIICKVTGRPQASTKPWPRVQASGGGAVIPCTYVVKSYQAEEQQEVYDMGLAYR